MMSVTEGTFFNKNFGGLGGSPPRIWLSLHPYSFETVASSRLRLIPLKSSISQLSRGVSQITFRYTEKYLIAEIVHPPKRITPTISAASAQSRMTRSHARGSWRSDAPTSKQATLKDTGAATYLST